VIRVADSSVEIGKSLFLRLHGKGDELKHSAKTTRCSFLHFYLPDDLEFMIRRRRH